MDGSSPCGMVKVTLTGQQMPVSCEINEEAMAEGAKAVGEKVRTPVRFMLRFWRKRYRSQALRLG